MKEIFIATRNKGKIADFKEIFSPYGIEVSSLLDEGDKLPEIAETGATFIENATLKAEGIAQIIQKPVLADDSGLVIDALDGAPGVYSARYAGENPTDKQNYEKVLTHMQAATDRRARFVCVLALAIPGGETIHKIGTCQGKITEAPEGEQGFGYDPIFVPEGFTKTMAQLTKAQKNTISHRYHALIKMKTWLDENQI